MPRKATTGTDPILEEVRSVKDRLAAAHDYDVVAMLRDVRTRERDGGGRVVSRENRTPQRA